MGTVYTKTGICECPPLLKKGEDFRDRNMFESKSSDKRILLLRSLSPSLPSITGGNGNIRSQRRLSDSVPLPQHSKSRSTKLRTMSASEAGTGASSKASGSSISMSIGIGSFRSSEKGVQKPNEVSGESTGPKLRRSERLRLKENKKAKGIQNTTNSKPNSSKTSREERQRGSGVGVVAGLGKLSLSTKDDSLEPNDTSQTSENELEIDVPKHVLYYGWFISPETSLVICDIAMHFLEACFNEVNQFQRFILSCCKDADVSEPLKYYRKPGKPPKPSDELKYHVTARFLGRNPDIEYQSTAHSFVGKDFDLHLTSLVFTRRTFGVRVKLTPSQKVLFDEKDEHRTGSKTSYTISDRIRENMDNELDNYKTILMKKTNSACKAKSHSTSPIIFKRIANSSETVSNSRAHITIGCAPKVVARFTGDDVVDINDLEQRPQHGNTNFQQDFKIEHGTLRQFGRHADAFVLYPDLEMIVPGEFKPFI